MQMFDQPVFPEARLGQIDNCLCLSVEAGVLRGFLVAAMAPNRRFDIPLITRIQKKLLEYLRKEGLAVNSSDEHMEITIRPVYFEAWAVEKAEFLKKSVHQGSEIALAFFPVDRVKPNIGPSKSEDMISVDIDDLVDDTPVSFDVFIHFPVNNKYILYVPKGRTFNTAQKQRLKAKGVTQMHTNKDATSEVNRYHVQNTLNESIERLDKKATKAK
jgi:hypothetical protein